MKQVIRNVKLRPFVIDADVSERVIYLYSKTRALLRLLVSEY